MTERVRQIFCGFHGHDSLLQFERDRMYLRCASCGYETPGWDLKEAPPVAKPREQPQTQPILQPQLIDARRVA